MSEDRHVYEPAHGHGLKHDPFNAIVAPRPIGWISTRNRAGQRNLAPYSFFNAFNYVPPIVGFASIGWKDSMANLAETGEFVWNLVTRDLAERMNATSANVGREVDEFDLAGLTSAPGLKVAAPRVAESPVNFECRVTQIVRLMAVTRAELDTWVAFGEVVMVHIDPAFLEGGVFQTAGARPVMRGGGLGDYFEIGPENGFKMTRPA